MEDEINISNSCFYIGNCSGCNCADVCLYYNDYEDNKYNDEEYKLNGK